MWRGVGAAFFFLKSMMISLVFLGCVSSLLNCIHVSLTCISVRRNVLIPPPVRHQHRQSVECCSWLFVLAPATPDVGCCWRDGAPPSLYKPPPQVCSGWAVLGLVTWLKGRAAGSQEWLDETRMTGQCPWRPVDLGFLRHSTLCQRSSPVTGSVHPLARFFPSSWQAQFSSWGEDAGMRVSGGGQTCPGEGGGLPGKHASGWSKLGPVCYFLWWSTARIVQIWEQLSLYMRD